MASVWYHKASAMSLTHPEYRQSVIEIGKLLHSKSWVAANDGNISIRLGEDRILATPTGVSKGRMNVDDLIVCDMDGKKIDGTRERTSEILMHLTIYQMRPDVNGIVHAHPPVSTGFAVAGRPLDLALLPEVIIGLGCIPLADYGLPGTPELSEALRPFIPTYDALLMANHGAVAYAEDVWKAFYKLETVEHFARITLVAELLGGPKVLPRTEVSKLLDSRFRYGVKRRPGAEPGCPRSLEDAPAAEEKLLLSKDDLFALIEEALRTRK